MRKLTLIFCVMAALSCGQRELPEAYKALVEQATLNAGDNTQEIKKAIKNVPENQFKAMCFLVAYMPESDLKTLSADYLLQNVEYAYKTREEFAWTKELNEDVFFNEVLPYAVLDEQRDNWRKDFYDRFAPMVRNAKNINQAIEIVNNAIKDEVNVEYSTKRKRACQGPHESMEQGLASCTGLSILLTDAFRAVGIPSRIAGTPLWVSKEGNHNWNEVLIGDTWYFTEYYPSGLNVSWFLERAGKGDPDNPIHSVFATSYKTAETHFPLVWAKESEQVHGVNVTQRYIDLYQTELSKQAESADNVVVGILMFDKKDNKSSENRVAVKIEVKVDGKTLVTGQTAGPQQDMNDYFKVQLPKNKNFTVEFTNNTAKGETITYNLKSGTENSKIELSFE